MPINDKVAFQTIPVTSKTSCQVTIFSANANRAPIQADQPIDNWRGCTITKK